MFFVQSLRPARHQAKLLDVGRGVGAGVTVFDSPAEELREDRQSLVYGGRFGPLDGLLVDLPIGRVRGNDGGRIERLVVGLLAPAGKVLHSPPILFDGGFTFIFSTYLSALYWDTTPPDSTVITNTASVTSATPVNVVADLSLDKRSTSTAFTGGTIVYTLTVFQQGPSDAQNVVVSDTLPAGVTFTSASAGCVNTGGTVVCTTPILPIQLSRISSG